MENGGQLFCCLMDDGFEYHHMILAYPHAWDWVEGVKGDAVMRDEPKNSLSVASGLTESILRKFAQANCTFNIDFIYYFFFHPLDASIEY